MLIIITLKHFISFSNSIDRSIKTINEFEIDAEFNVFLRNEIAQPSPHLMYFVTLDKINQNF